MTHFPTLPASFNNTALIIKLTKILSKEGGKRISLLKILLQQLSLIVGKFYEFLSDPIYDLWDLYIYT